MGVTNKLKFAVEPANEIKSVMETANVMESIWKQTLK